MYIQSHSIAGLARKYGHNYLDLAPVPQEEQCIQCGGEHDSLFSKLEAEVLCKQLLRANPGIPEGAKLITIKNYHDFGIYYEAAILFEENNEAACDYAYNLEENIPDHWDAEAKQELIENEHPLYVGKVLQMKKTG